MKPFFYKALIGLVVLSALAACDNTTVSEVLEKSVSFHGGSEEWTNIKAVEYHKKTQLFTQNGDLEKESEATYKHMFRPTFTTYKTLVEEGKVNLTRMTGIAAKDSLPFASQAEYQQAKKDLDAAFYVVWQPFKLLEEQEQLEYLGTEQLEDKTEVYVLKNQYYKDDGSQDNTWWFYFNKKNGRLEGNMVKHGTTFSYIRNTSYEQKTGLSLNKTRTSYRVDSLRNIEFVRAKYWYEYK